MPVPVLSVGDRVRVTTRHHGHAAAARTPTFRGVVDAVGDEHDGNRGPFRYVTVRLEPSMKTTRVYRTDVDSIEVIP